MKSIAHLDYLDPHCASQSQLLAWAHALVEQVNAQEKQLAIQASEIFRKKVKIDLLTHELAYWKRMKFGVKSESLGVAQRDVFEETWESDVAAIEEELSQLRGSSAQSPVKKPKRSHAGRQPLPAHLPRIEHYHEPASCQCEECGRALVKIGEDISEQLDVQPAQFFVHRHIRPQYACRQCETITAAPIAAAIIDGGLPTVGLLTWVLIGKYQDHLPLYRLAQIAARDQVNLACSTLADWVGRTGVALQPLVDRLTTHLLAGNTLLADETPVSQLDPGKGKTHKSYLWAYRSNDLQAGPRIVVFDYKAGRSGAHARRFLGSWSGHLMVDDYGGYKSLFLPEGNKPACIELACLAHARRKFFDLHQVSQSPLALEALTRIAALYEIEAQGREMTLEERKALRAKQSLPQLLALKAWLMEKQMTLAPSSGAAKAVHYMLKRWSAFERYAHTGHLPIDNNTCENTIRPIALGKKNWLFVGSERAGKRAAAIQSLLGTAKLNGLNPTQWLNETLEKLPSWPYSRIDELLPLSSDALQKLNH